VRILLDQGTPAPLRRELSGHQVLTAYEMGWAQLKNGELLNAAEVEFEIFITTDQNLRYQQNLMGRRLAILVLPTTSWPRIRAHAGELIAAVNELQPGEFRQLSFD
jgi:hypothetical protein